MANGLGSKVQLAELAFAWAQRLGKWGIPGVLLIAAKAAVVFASKPSFGAAADALGTVGWCMVIIGIMATTKRANLMIATTAAEQKIQSPNLLTESKDPAVQREITTQLDAGGPTARKTGDVEIPKS